MWWTRRPKSYAGCHVCITGGSEGLGFALAKLFVEEDANVSIIARTAAKLDRAKAALQESGHSGNRVVAVTADCNEVESIHSAIRKAEEELGAVDVLIANAGTAVPGKFLDTKISDFESQMRLNYLGTVYTVKAVAASMVQRGQGEVIIISSALGVLGLTGYAAYAPTKWALRGLADCLRMELHPYGVTVRIAYPPNMRTPGYEEELKTTPAEVQDIMDASGDTVFAPRDVAVSILKGMKQNRYHLPSPDSLQTLSQSVMAGLSPVPYCLPLQALINFLCTFVFAYLSWVFDRITARHAERAKKRH